MPERLTGFLGMPRGNFLPQIMVAPNGARRTKDDHPNLPITIPELVSDAIACHKAGADAIHVHVRDIKGQHTLDIGLYREVMKELETTVPNMLVQLTTESAGIYSPSEQRDILPKLGAQSVSVAIREFLADGECESAGRAYHQTFEKGTDIQHILYTMQDIDLLARMITKDIVPSARLQILLVMGTYGGIPARFEDLEPLLSHVDKEIPNTELAVCAFGRQETRILSTTLKQGHNIRVGFENNLYHDNGEIAKDNASRVAEVLRFISD